MRFPLWASPHQAYIESDSSNQESMSLYILSGLFSPSFPLLELKLCLVKVIVSEVAFAWGLIVQCGVLTPVYLHCLLSLPLTDCTGGTGEHILHQTNLSKVLELTQTL